MPLRPTFGRPSSGRGDGDQWVTIRKTTEELSDSSSTVFIDGERKINLPRRLHAKCFTELDIPVNRMHGAGGDIVGFRVEQGRPFLSIGISDPSLAPERSEKTRTKQGLDVDDQSNPDGASSLVPDA
jgi:hypothetical protein